MMGLDLHPEERAGDNGGGGDYGGQYSVFLHCMVEAAALLIAKSQVLKVEDTLEMVRCNPTTSRMRKWKLMQVILVLCDHFLICNMGTVTSPLQSWCEDFCLQWAQHRTCLQANQVLSKFNSLNSVHTPLLDLSY